MLVGAAAGAAAVAGALEMCETIESAYHVDRRDRERDLRMFCACAII